MKDESDETGGPSGTALSGPEQKQTEIEQSRLETQLQQPQKMEAMGRLVAGVAHEINNPLNQLRVNLTVFMKIWRDFFPLLGEIASNEPGRKYGGLSYDYLKENLDLHLSDMDLAVDRMLKMVTDLKDFARQAPLEDAKPFQINNAVERAVRLVSATLRIARIELRVHLEDGLPLVMGNCQNIEQILLNLILNGSEAIDHDHGLIEVASHYLWETGDVVVSVSDNGSGIDENIRDRIFDPFVTSKQARGGTGLGLAVARSLVKANQGEISFETMKGKGTAFHMEFPAVLSRRGAVILIADDDFGFRRMLTMVLSKRRHYLIQQAENGADVCIKLGVYRPDLLILDIAMPGMDGLEVCRNIRKEPLLDGMKVIIMTGFPDDERLKQIAGLGFTNIHIKPFDPSGFLKSVDEMIGS